MSKRTRDVPATIGLAIFLLLLLSALLGELPAGVTMLVLLLGGIGLYYLVTGLYSHADEDAIPKERHTHDGRLDAPPGVVLDDLFEDASHAHAGGVLRVRGPLAVPSHMAAQRLSQRMEGTGWTAILDEEGGGEHGVTLVPDELLTRPSRGHRRWVHPLLLGLTFVTTTWAGAAHSGAHVLADPALLLGGIPYSLPLLLILGAHEMGHYFAARCHGMSVSLPYFVPIPFGLGTFGAFISLRSPARTRKALFDMAVTGPLAGLPLAIPALLVGLPLSAVVAPAVDGTGAGGGLSLGSSLLLAALAKLSIGPMLTDAHAVQLHPLAFAGWLGLLLTALNLLPIGQLDGGHIADAMLGRRRGALVGTLALVTLFALGVFVWSGLLMWAFIIYFVAGRKGFTALDNITPLDGGRRALGVVAFVLLLVILLPVPHALWHGLGIHCPYL